jgi:hypothetical protein
MEIQNYPDYLIYSDGRVYSKKRNKFLKEQTHRLGYKNIMLGAGNLFYIHRLVAIHYIPNPENLKEVDHLNRDKSDNRVENLRWINHSENCQNKGMNITNKSGHKYISYDKSRDRWVYNKTINKQKFRKYSKSKIECICYKFIIELLTRRRLLPSYHH